MELQQRVRAEYELTQDTSAQLEALKRIEQVWVGGFAFAFFVLLRVSLFGHSDFLCMTLSVSTFLCLFSYL